MRFFRQKSATEAAIRPEYPARTLVILFLVAIALGALVLTLPISAADEPHEWSTTLFTATSAVCVTGLVVVDTATAFSEIGQAVILVLIQIGGLGYMTASTFLALVMRRQPGLSERVLLRETLGHVTLRDVGRLVFLALGFTLAVEAVGAAILAYHFLHDPRYTLEEAVWNGVFHSVSAFCNAGFDLMGQHGHPVGSLALYQDDWVVTSTIAGLIIIGGIGFPVVYELATRHRHEPRPLSLHTRIVLLLTGVMLVSGMVLVLVTEWSNPATLRPLPWPQKLMDAFFQSVTLRTAGFSTLDFNALRSITLMFMGAFMFIGASPGGTGGGVKTTTFAVTLAAIWASIRGYQDPEIFRRRIPTELVYRALVLIFLSVMIVVLGTFILVFTEPVAIQRYGIRDNLFVRIQFEAISAFGTVGLSTGITPALTEVGRIVIIVLMFLGRLGPLTVAGAWAGERRVLKRRLPEEKVSLG